MSNIWSKLTNLGGLITGTLGIGNGGTGQTTKSAAFDALSPMTTAGDVIYGGASGTGTRLAIGSSGTVLHGGGSAPSYSQIVDADVSSSAAISGSKITTVTQSVAGVVTSAGQLLGTNTNDNPTAGNVGEILESIVTRSAGGNPSSNTVFNIANLTLTAGDWLIFGQSLWRGGTATAVSNFQAVINTVNNAFPASNTNASQNVADVQASQDLTAGDVSVTLCPYRISISGSTTYYLNSLCTFGSGSVVNSGRMTAIRIR